MYTTIPWLWLGGDQGGVFGWVGADFWWVRTAGLLGGALSGMAGVGGGSSQGGQLSIQS